jgi:hypothetical protein
MIIGCFTFYTCFQDAAQLSGFFLIDFAFGLSDRDGLETEFTIR